MKNRTLRYGLPVVAMMALISGCAESEAIVYDDPIDNTEIIHIGGIDRDVVSTSLAGYTTRAAGDNESVDAETVEWLLGPLFGGLDITYGRKKVNSEDDTHERVAILKLLKNDPSSDDISSSNIKYSQYIGPEGEKIAEYSFKYRTGVGIEGDDAIWYDNGAHYFQGVFVPGNLRYLPDAPNSETLSTVNDPTNGKAKSLKLDQSKDGNEDNYTLLARYLGMPADASIHATVGRVKLPFRHRLARVLAYVLIDPTMGNDVTIQGYDLVNGKDDAATSEIRFCNVDVLAGVEEKDDATGHATLTPRWDTSRKVIPHFVEESVSKNSLGDVVNATNFIMFYDTENKEYIFPADDDKWTVANTKWNSAYNEAWEQLQEDDSRRESKAAEAADKNSKLKRTKYGKVPVYDLIVRPTYKSEEMVMYDEDLTNTTKENLVTLKNNIDFEITLSNGLEYTKQFEFDLDANYQTIVYLRISRESIDYNSSGADKWMEDSNSDGYYGVNNQNGNTLSYAGSSWQRAYRIGSTNPNVTDGHYYGQDDASDADDVQDDDAMPWYPQYVDQAKWIEMFAEAHEGGLHHGDYFILDSNITIDATKLPDNFVFTGHLDGQDYTITLTNAGTNWTEYVATTEYNISPLYSDKNGTEYNLPTLYTKVHHDANYTSDDEFLEINGVTYIKRTLEHIAEVWHEATEEDVTNGKAEKVGDKVVDTEEGYNVVETSQVKQEAYDEYLEAHPTVEEAMTAAAETYYEKLGDDNYKDFYDVKPSVLYKAIAHTSGTTLFAGLNGIYETNQERGTTPWEANVHKEGGIWLPYRDVVGEGASNTGWRAEVINTKISGADMFPVDAIKADGNYDVDKVSGYIYNCWKGSEKIKSHTPTLPKYK